MDNQEKHIVASKKADSSKTKCKTHFPQIYYFNAQTGARKLKCGTFIRLMKLNIRSILSMLDFSTYYAISFWLNATENDSRILLFHC